jgi:hypothetical protein
MTNIVRFVSRSELERERLIREARAIYDSIFPSAAAPGHHDRSDQRPAREAAAEIQPRQQ